MSTPIDYVFDRLDPADDSDAARERRSAWLQAVSYGFHDGRTSETFESMWREHVEADDVECRGAWLPDTAYGASPMPVATLAWFDKTLNAGRELLPCRLVTDVTTRPTHRRRGLVRRLMEDCLADAVEHGLPLAALLVSEGTIYGRYGYGAATFSRKVTVDTGPGFGLRGFSDPGRVELVDPRTSWDLVAGRLDVYQQRHRGAVGTPGFYEQYFTGRWNHADDGEDKQLRAAVHLVAADDGTEQVDGLTIYKIDGRDDQDRRRIRVLLLESPDPTSQLALWSFLAGIDLVGSLTHHPHEATDPLRWALTDINSLKVTGHDESLWVRVLDLPRAFAARPWASDGRVVLGVTDPLGHVAGSWAVDVVDGVATTTRTDDAADVRLDAETLGTLYLGPVPVQTLQAAGRLQGDAAAVARLAAMADLPDEPLNLLSF